MQTKIVNKANNKQCCAIFAETGPADKIGEGSIFLAQQLGIKGTAKIGGADKDIVYILIKNSGNGKVATYEEIISRGKAKLKEVDIAELLK